MLGFLTMKNGTDPNFVDETKEIVTYIKIFA